MKRFEVKLSERLCKCGHPRRKHDARYLMPCRVDKCTCHKLDMSKPKRCVCGHEQGMHADGEQWCRTWQSTFGDGSDRKCNCLRFVHHQCQFEGCTDDALYITLNDTKLCKDHAEPHVDRPLYSYGIWRCKDHGGHKP